MVQKIKSVWSDRALHTKSARWLWGLARPYLGRLLASVSITVAATAVSLATTVISKYIIDTATLRAQRNEILILLVGYLLLTLATQGFTVLGSFLGVRLGENCTFGIREENYNRLLHSEWLRVQQYHTGDIMTRLTSDIGAVADGIVNVFPNILALGVQLLLVFFTLFYYSPVLALSALFIAPVMALLAALVGRRLKGLTVKVQESEAEYRSFLQESLANLLIVKAFSYEKPSLQRFDTLRKSRFHWVLKQFRISITTSTLVYFAFQIGYILAFTYGALQIAAGAITFGTMTVFLALVNRVQGPIIELARKLPATISVLASAGRVMELQDIPEEDRGGGFSAQRLGVRIEGLCFAYHEKEPVFEDAFLEIRPGECVALVGESGIGKTTLIRLLESFVSGNDSAVTFFNERGETAASSAATRRHISYVPQGNTLFSGSIRANVLMGRAGATDGEVREALRMAAAQEFVDELPDGLDTRIGERGHGLSEGQAQRIAIARALIRRSPFLILDEATSALDEQTELAVLAALGELDPKPTCLLITHRKSVLPYCDRVIRIKGSRFVEASA